MDPGTRLLRSEQRAAHTGFIIEIFSEEKTLVPPFPLTLPLTPFTHYVMLPGEWMKFPSNLFHFLPQRLAEEVPCFQFIEGTVLDKRGLKLFLLLLSPPPHTTPPNPFYLSTILTSFIVFLPCVTQKLRQQQK